MVTTQPAPIESHDVHSERLMRHAWERLDQGDRLQASEKCWGAVVHALKAIARRHGWRHRTHVHNNTIAAHLSALTGDTQIYLLYEAMQAMHVNYYYDTKTEQEIRFNLHGAADLLGRLAAAERRIGANPPAPDYDRRSGACSG